MQTTARSAISGSAKPSMSDMTGNAPFRHQSGHVARISTISNPARIRRALQQRRCQSLEETGEGVTFASLDTMIRI